MPCEERVRLDLEYSQAKARYEAARETLHSKIGVSSRDEFLGLSQAIDHAWVALERARYLLEHHIGEHHCEASGEAQGEAAAEA